MYKWFEKDGHVYSEEVKLRKSQDFRFGKNFESNVVIAFNVGSKTAKYIADLHNKKCELD